MLWWVSPVAKLRVRPQKGRGIEFFQKLAIVADCTIIMERLRFASDGIWCAATFIGEIIAFEFVWFCWDSPEEGGGIEFPRKPAILADCTTIIDKLGGARTRLSTRSGWASTTAARHLGVRGDYFLWRISDNLTHLFWRNLYSHPTHKYKFKSTHIVTYTQCQHPLDWFCFYYFKTNSLVPLLESLCALMTCVKGRRTGVSCCFQQPLCCRVL